ncbi:MAG: hypothetical protein QME96_14005 [Myxococcota bacterium]|nr:hypothetical protein [Myxococcota bacterium]
MGLLRRLVPVVAGALTFAVWFVRAFLLHPKGRFAETGILDYLTKDRLLAKIPEYLLNGFRGDGDARVLVVFGLTVLVCLAATQSWRAQDTRGEPLLVRYRAEIAVVATFALYLILPVQIPGIWYICPRLVLPAALLLITTIRFEPRGLSAAVLIPIAALNVVWPLQVLGHFRAVSRQAGDLDGAIAVMAPGKKVLGLMFHGDEGVMTWNPFLHAAAYAVVEKGGGLGFSFAYSPAVPIGYRAPEEFPHPNEWRPGDFAIEAHGRFYDYLLVRGRRHAHPNPFGRQYLRAGIDYYGEWWSVYHVLSAPRITEYDFVQHIDTARVELIRDGVATPCPKTDRARFQCGTRIWEYVGIVDGRADGGVWKCVWVHPYERASLRITFKDVPIGSAIYGLYGLVDSAVVSTGPRLAVRVGDGPQNMFGHEGKGALSLMYVDTASSAGVAADVTFEIASDNVGSQHACFLGATVR